MSDQPAPQFHPPAPAPQDLGAGVRQVLFSPETTGNQRLKMLHVKLPPGGPSALHLHLGEEALYTISGHAVVVIQGQEYHLTAGSGLLVPAGFTHPVQVLGDEPWEAVAAFCDACPVLKKDLGREGVTYPVDVPAGQK